MPGKDKLVSYSVVGVVSLAEMDMADGCRCSWQVRIAVPGELDVVSVTCMIGHVGRGGASNIFYV